MHLCSIMHLAIESTPERLVAACGAVMTIDDMEEIAMHVKQWPIQHFGFTMDLPDVTCAECRANAAAVTTG